MKKRIGNQGFSLIELLVVIAIIGLLSTIVVASLSTVRKKARDAKRVADLRSLELGLELYSVTNKAYPPSLGNGNATANLATLVAGGFMPSIPRDPLGSSYTYAGCTNGGTIVAGYHLGASLEDSTNTALGADSDVDQNTTNCPGDFRGLNTSVPSTVSTAWGCGSGSSAAAGTPGPGGTELCYDIKR